jgi:hypothetical protein
MIRSPVDGAIMTATLPWSTSARNPPSTDPSEVLQRIGRNTTSLHHWIRILVVVVIVFDLIIVFVG